MKIPKDLISYFETALWCSFDDNSDPLDQNYAIEDISPECMEKAQKDLNKFKELAGDLLNGLDSEQVAHDFWLTRNRHGAGFWDGDYLESIGNKLTEIAHSFGEVNLYVAADMRIYS
jgi:hypothetical protein